MSRSGRWLTLFQGAAGLSDTSTGLLLIFAPAWTLRLMGVRWLPQPIEFAGFIGVFVLSVGLTYLLVAVRWPIARQNTVVWEVQWWITALVRTLVAVFLLVEIVSGRMEFAWISVALSDGMLAVIQWIGLARGWLKNVG